ncbi:MAG: bZIP transcription factor, partial [Planctomycetota bacterium]
MLKRFLVCLPVVLLLAAAYSGPVQAADKPDLEDQIKELKSENKDLKGQVQRLEAKVDEALSKSESEDPMDRIAHPERYYQYLNEEDMAQQGFIKKGSLTGTFDKLMDINLFTGVRYTQINNSSTNVNDVDDFDIPFARLILSGDAYTGIGYAVQYDFARTDEELMEAVLEWTPALGECPGLEDFAVTAGLTQIFISPAGMHEPWNLDFIEFPLFVHDILPPGEARDIGIFTRMDMLDQGRFKVWFGVSNGTHREIIMDATPFGPIFNDIEAFDVWGNGQDNDGFASSGRTQLNVLDE